MKFTGFDFRDNFFLPDINENGGGEHLKKQVQPWTNWTARFCSVPWQHFSRYNIVRFVQTYTFWQHSQHVLTITQCLLWFLAFYIIIPLITIVSFHIRFEALPMSHVSHLNKWKCHKNLRQNTLWLLTKNCIAEINLRKKKQMVWRFDPGESFSKVCCKLHGVQGQYFLHGRQIHLIELDWNENIYYWLSYII